MTEGRPIRKIIRNRRQRQRQLKRRLAFSAAVLLAVLSLTGGSFAVKAQNTSAGPLYKYYTSIRVGKGDSLWSIADRHADGYFESKQDFLQEVIQINHLLDSDIRQGDYLIIPYYSSEFKR